MPDYRTDKFSIANDESSVTITSTTLARQARDDSVQQTYIWELTSREQVQTFLDELFAAANDVQSPVPCGTVRLGGASETPCLMTVRPVFLPPTRGDTGADARLVVTAWDPEGGSVDILDLDMLQVGDLYRSVLSAATSLR